MFKSASGSSICELDTTALLPTLFIKLFAMKLPLHIICVQLLLFFIGIKSTALPTLLYKWETLPLSLNEFGQMIEHSNITDNCKAHTRELLFRLTSPEHLVQSPWAFQMIDSWGKFPEGILRGHLNSLGDYDECVSVDVSKLRFLGFGNRTEKYSTKFRGLYCMVALQLPVLTLLPNSTEDTYSDESNSGDLVQKLMNHLAMKSGHKLFPSVGLCFPNSCSTGDVNTIVGHVIPKIVPSANSLVLGECSIARSSNFDAGFWVLIGIFSLLLAIIAVGTAMDLVKTKQRKEFPHSIQAVVTTVQSFSVARNIQNLLKTESKGGLNLECIHGIRFLTMLWIILSHTWLMLLNLPVWNAVEAEELNWKLNLSPIVNGDVSVDTFITVTGVLVSFSLLKLCDTTKGRLPFFWLYVHRFVRLTPAYAVLIGVFAYILPYLSNGPFWFTIEDQGAKCRANWWTNLLYLNNFIHPENRCAGHGWYLAVDMQLYILAPLIVFPMWRYPTVGVTLLSVVTMLAIPLPGLQSHFQHFLPTFIRTRAYDESMHLDQYVKPWTYLQPYLVGIWLGFCLFRNSCKEGWNLSRLQVATGWLLSTVIALAVLYGINPWFDPNTEIPHIAGCLYASLHRFAWAICICWIIYACSHGHGGCINRFLSWKLFIPLGRLTYCAYLVSVPITGILHVSRRQPLYYSFYSMIYLFVGHTVISLGVSFIWTILFESPFIQLEKLVRTGNSHKST